MKKLILILMVGSLFMGCATKAVDNTESSEPKETTESAEGVMPEMPIMPDVQIPEVSDIPQIPDKTKSQKGKDISIDQVVETACGQCQLGMTEDSGCDLAIRIDGKSYFVDGTNIHEHGDAHADDGFCEVIRRASVKGKIIDGTIFTINTYHHRLGFRWLL